jgi:hypothetical protein
MADKILNAQGAISAAINGAGCSFQPPWGSEKAGHGTVYLQLHRQSGLNTQDWREELPCANPVSRFNELFHSSHILTPYLQKNKVHEICK